jgi:EF hand
LIPATQVIASDPQNARSVVGHLFETADVDRSGTLSPAEYGEAELDAYGVGFEASDRNGDGETTLEEYLDLYERHHPNDPGTEV